MAGTCTVTGNVLNPLGVALPSSPAPMLSVQLVNYGTYLPQQVGGSQTVSTAPFYVSVDPTTGAYSFSVVGNDQILPANTLYLIKFPGNALNYLFYITGSTFNLNTAVPAGVNMPIYSNMPALLSGNNDFIGTNNFSNLGLFDNLASHEYVESDLNGASAASMFFAEQGEYATEAMAAAVIVPVGATEYQVNGLGAYVDTFSTTTNAVAIYGQMRARVNSAHGWGANFVADDRSFTGVTMAGIELDCNVNQTGTTGSGLQITGYFAASPTSFPAVVVDVGGIGKWSAGFATAHGASQTGISLGAQGTGASQASQTFNLSGITPGSAVVTAYIQASDEGTLILVPSPNSGVILLDGAIQQVGKTSLYNGVSTVGNGVPAEYAAVDLTAQSAAITATTLYAVPASGMYRISWCAKVTTAGGSSSTLGGTNGFQIEYTDADDSTTPTTPASATSAGNLTTTQLSGVIVVNAKIGTNIGYSMGYTSSGSAMAYSLHIKCEAL